MKKPLQGQHYKMAAIIAKGWAYDEVEDKRGRKKSVCQFDTSKFFKYTNKDKEKNGKKYFTFMKIKKNRNKKIEECVSDDPQLKNGRNTVIDKIFMSHLIRQETEKKLNVINIEKRFLKLLNTTNNLQDKKLIQRKSSIKVMKDYIALQYVRNPLFYRFLIDKFYTIKLSEMCNKIEDRVYSSNYPIAFKELTLLDNKRITDLIDFCNHEIIVLYKDYREMLNNCFLITYSHESVNNYLGDMSSFNFDFERFGANLNEVQKMTDYKNNKQFLNDCIYTVASKHSFIMAIDKKHLDINIESKFANVILPIILKGFHNSLVFLYSKYIICDPLRKEAMIKDIQNFFNVNSIKYFYDVRQEEISYLETLELLLNELKEHEDNFR